MIIHSSALDILLVEDNRDIADNLISFLEDKNHRIDYANTGHSGLALVRENHYDVLILDVMLPGLTGFELATCIRQELKQSTPILFLTARDTLHDKLEGFTAGGDDYLTKPFAIEELEMRILALGRRAKGLTNTEVRAGDWLVNSDTLEIRYQQTLIKTTNIGFTIFQALVSQHPNVLTRRHIEKLIWSDEPPDSDALRSHMFMLRKALATATKAPVIETVHGVGFRLLIRTD